MNKKRAKITLTLFALIVLGAVFIIVKTSGNRQSGPTLVDSITLDDVRNSTVILEGKTISLSDFSALAKGLPGDKGSGCRVTLRQDMVASGDVNNDQKGDLAGIVGVDCGVGRHDVYLAVWTGNRESITAPIGTLLIGDRVPIFGVEIDSSLIRVSRGAEYGGVSSVAIQKTSTYGVYNEHLREESQSGDPITTLPASDWKLYSNAKYGFSFSYPSEWGTVKEFVEKGSCPAKILTAQDQCIHISLAFSDVKGSGIFLSTATNLYAKYPNKNRGGYWGDSALSIKSKDYLYGFCTNREAISCGLINNSFGTEYLRYHNESCINDSDKSCDKVVLYYYIKSTNPTFYSALISDAYLLNVENAQTLMEEMMATFRFLK